jgi:hypothetical protein
LRVRLSRCSAPKRSFRRSGGRASPVITVKSDAPVQLIDFAA